MKARHKKTGREIIILGISKEWGTVTFIAEGVLHQENLTSGEWEIIDESEPTDWQAFRRETAKQMLPITSNWKLTKADGSVNIPIGKEAACKLAIEYADELIKQLKEDKK